VQDISTYNLKKEVGFLGDWILVLIVLFVVNSFVLYLVIKNAIDNSSTLKKIESLLMDIAKDSTKK